MTIVSTTVGKNPSQEVEQPSESTTESEMQYLGAISKTTEWSIFVRFQGKPLNITVIQVYAPTTKAKEAEVEWFFEDLLEPKKDVLFVIGD